MITSNMRFALVRETIYLIGICSNIHNIALPSAAANQRRERMKIVLCD